jgi:hypothetical protein
VQAALKEEEEPLVVRLVRQEQEQGRGQGQRKQ